MIQAKDLRVGNFLNHLEMDIKNHVEVCVIDRFDPKIFVTDQPLGYKYETILDKLTPIPLTSEWLEKFGFELNEDLGDQKYYQLPSEKCGYGIEFDHEEIVFYKFRQFAVDTLIHDEPFLQYVHQLQNVWFCLTGKELEIKK